MRVSVQHHCQENQRRSSSSGAMTDARTAAASRSSSARLGSAGVPPVPGAASAAELLEFVADAVSDERRAELLMRGLTVAQDCALLGKRRAAGKSIAAGVANKGTRVAPELLLLLLRVLDDLDVPHLRLPTLMSEPPAYHNHPERPLSALPVG